MKEKIVKERLETHVNFFDPIKRSELKTFESANKNVIVKTPDKRLIENKRQEILAFQLLVQAQSLDEKVNMKLLMSFSLTPVPLSIGKSDGMLLKTNEAKGMHYLLRSQSSPEKPDENFTLVTEDGKALIYALKDISLNFKEIYLKLFAMVSSKTCYMIFSTDIYHPDSAKSMERRARGSEYKLIIKGANTKKQKCWKEFLSNDENKQQMFGKPI